MLGLPTVCHSDHEKRMAFRAVNLSSEMSDEDLDFLQLPSEEAVPDIYDIAFLKLAEYHISGGGLLVAAKSRANGPTYRECPPW